MAGPKLTLACWDYDRTRALLEGRVGVAGWRIDAKVQPPEETFPRAVADAPFDVSELSLSSYRMQVSRGEGAYIAIPAFVSRAFHHGAIYVRTKRGIETPKDLEGRLVGVPEYQMTMALWVRGILGDEYGVDFRKIRYRTGGANKPGRKERLALELPEDMDVAPIPEGSTLNELLLAGELDAVIAPTPPDGFTAGDKAGRRLFTDPAAEEWAYYARTGLFPIMHVIGVRRTLADEHPGLAADLFRAFVEARNLAMREHDLTARSSANRMMLPWFADQWEATKDLMGDDFWPYGVAENRPELEAVCRYSHEQNLGRKRLSVEALFAPETVELPGI
ncbi:MAG: ABC transporter substrate-binding protein [Rhodospirillales bacterium]|nr:ABC transporter substrate-binding protein [Rhodospirillales bacterium]